MTGHPTWFADARFGMFVHWGLYSILGRGEWVMFKGNIPKEKYNKLTEKFHPDGFDPGAWVALAKQAGAKYVVLTARHHDGFCLYDSRVSDFTSVRTRAGRDFIRDYVRACRKAGLKVGIYYSLGSWQHAASFVGPWKDPAGWAAMVDEAHAQVRELMTGYGRIDLLWYDGAFHAGADAALIGELWRARELNAMVRKLQPQIVINDRSGTPEDYSSPEQHVAPPKPGRLWEACMTIGATAWGYVKDETRFLSTQTLLTHLLAAARHGGNLLVNIGPRADGSVQKEFTKPLLEIGRWLAVNGEAIYGSERLPFTEADHLLGAATAKGRTAYFHIDHWPCDSGAIAGVTGSIRRAYLVADGRKLTVLPASNGVVALRDFPKQAPDPNYSVVAVELSEGARLQTPPGILGDGAAQHNEAEDINDPTPGPAPVIQGADLADLVVYPPRSVLSCAADWAPAFPGRQMAAAQDGRLELEIAVPVSGRYSLNVGIAAARPGPLAVSLDGTSLTRLRRLRVGSGYPDTLASEILTLKQGRWRLKLQTPDGNPFGLYAIRLNPRWRPFGTERWLAIGPFPTAFGPQSPLSDVKAALAKRFPPEREFVRDAVYPGANGLSVGWNAGRVRRGLQEANGVNFFFRCGNTAGGICYARTIIRSPEARDAMMLIGGDWWANAFLNGRPLISARDRAAVNRDGAQFSGCRPISATARLRKGENTLLVKCHRGSNCNWFVCFVSDPGDLEIGTEMGRARIRRSNCLAGNTFLLRMPRE